MRDERRAGIYRIRNLVDGKVYVGSAKSCRARHQAHRRELDRGTHRNQHLQRAWDKYGADAFAFEVLEVVGSPGPDILIAREQHWMDELSAVENGYNICPAAGSRLGTTLSEEHIAAIVAANTGKPCSAETKERISKANAGKKRTQAMNDEQSRRSRGCPNPHAGHKQSDATREKKRRASKAMWAKRRRGELPTPKMDNSKAVAANRAKKRERMAAGDAK